MSYKTFLKSIGRKPVRGPIRTKKTAGSIELVWDQRVRDYVPVIHEGEPEKPKLKLVQVVKRRAAA